MKFEQTTSTENPSSAKAEVTEVPGEYQKFEKLARAITSVRKQEIDKARDEAKRGQ